MAVDIKKKSGGSEENCPAKSHEPSTLLRVYSPLLHREEQNFRF